MACESEIDIGLNKHKNSNGLFISTNAHFVIPIEVRNLNKIQNTDL